jgi:hypothetical protein
VSESPLNRSAPPAVNTVDGPATRATTDEPAHDPTAQGDGLEHWLQDLRTGLTDDPPDWMDANPAGDGLTIAQSDTAGTQAAAGDGGIQPGAPTLSTVGRHRAPE